MLILGPRKIIIIQKLRRIFAQLLCCGKGYIKGLCAPCRALNLSQNPAQSLDNAVLDQILCNVKANIDVLNLSLQSGIPGLMNLNQRQRAAVRYLDGPLLVLAGAGSGKTRVITHKIAYLINECGISPRHIIAVTFTNKAAREMKERVVSLLGSKNTRGLHVSTFHTLGLKIVRQEAQPLGYKPGFSIFDAEDSASLIKELMRTDYADDGGMAKRVQWQISQWKGALVTEEEALRDSDDPATNAAALIYSKYQRHLRVYNAVDFDDLIYLPVKLFTTNSRILDKWQNRTRYLLVDEYQDTNSSQYHLVKLLAGTRRALTVVGDDDQSIYAWRGARPENMNQLKQDFLNLRVIKLEQNYRSAGRILKAANQLIANNDKVFDKTLWSELGYGDPLRVIRTRDEEHEAEQVVSELISHRFKHRTAFRDYAILYRGNHQARLFERKLREHNVPYYLSGGTSFFSHTEIKDLMAYLRLLVNNDDDAAFLRIINTPRREIGASTIEKLAAYAGERGISLFSACFELGLQQRLSSRAYSRITQFGEWLVGVSDNAHRGDPIAVIRQLIDTTDYELWLRDNATTERAAERRINNVHELVEWMQRIRDKELTEKTLAELVAHLSLMDILERGEDERADDRVHLMTFHAAKGLEFSHVFMVGMEEELLPHRTSIEEETVQEERRLAYVGITRAQKSLTFTLAARRKQQGEKTECAPSRFLEELPDEDLVWEGHGEKIDPARRQEKGQAHLANLKDILGST